MSPNCWMWRNKVRVILSHLPLTSTVISMVVSGPKIIETSGRVTLSRRLATLCILLRSWCRLSRIWDHPTRSVSQNSTGFDCRGIFDRTRTSFFPRPSVFSQPPPLLADSDPQRRFLPRPSHVNGEKRSFLLLYYNFENIYKSQQKDINGN